MITKLPLLGIVSDSAAAETASDKGPERRGGRKNCNCRQVKRHQHSDPCINTHTVIITYGFVMGPLPLQSTGQKLTAVLKNKNRSFD